MSHWTSGLPKLDIQPFDPTPLYEAVAETNRERAQVAARRRSMMRPLLAGVAVVLLGSVVAAAVLVLG